MIYYCLYVISQLLVHLSRVLNPLFVCGTQIKLQRYLAVPQNAKIDLKCKIGHNPCTTSKKPVPPHPNVETLT